jgi:hypothetical protein
MKKFAEMISEMSDRELTKAWKTGRATCSVIAVFLGLMVLVGILTVIVAQASGDSALETATGWGSCWAAVNGLALIATLFCRKSKIKEIPRYAAHTEVRGKRKKCKLTF